jgi:hypothetical protein
MNSTKEIRQHSSMLWTYSRLKIYKKNVSPKKGKGGLTNNVNIAEFKDNHSTKGTHEQQRMKTIFKPPVKKIYTTRASQDYMSMYATQSKGNLTNNTPIRKKPTPQRKKTTKNYSKNYQQLSKAM